MSIPDRGGAKTVWECKVIPETLEEENKLRGELRLAPLKDPNADANGELAPSPSSGGLLAPGNKAAKTPSKNPLDKEGKPKDARSASIKVPVPDEKVARRPSREASTARRDEASAKGSVKASSGGGKKEEAASSSSAKKDDKAGAKKDDCKKKDDGKKDELKSSQKGGLKEKPGGKTAKSPRGSPRASTSSIKGSIKGDPEAKASAKKAKKPENFIHYKLAFHEGGRFDTIVYYYYWDDNLSVAGFGGKGGFKRKLYIELSGMYEHRPPSGGTAPKLKCDVPANNGGYEINVFSESMKAEYNYQMKYNADAGTLDLAGLIMIQEGKAFAQEYSKVKGDPNICSWKYAGCNFVFKDGCVELSSELA